jgi:hypothetical protein
MYVADCSVKGYYKISMTVLNTVRHSFIGCFGSLFFLLILSAVPSAAEERPLAVTFSAGSIGGGGAFLLGRTGGDAFINGSLFDMYIEQPVSRFGLVLSPFEFSAALNHSYSGYSFINAAIYHESIKFGDNSFIGPYAKIRCLDFRSSQPVYEVGFRLVVRTEAVFTVNDKAVGFFSPFLIKFIGVDTGVRYTDHSPELFTNVSVDLASLVPLILMCASGHGHDEIKKNNVPAANAAYYTAGR